MTHAMTRSSPPRLAPLGVLLWWAATSSALPFHTIAGAPYETDGPAAHELSPRPVGHGADLGFERGTDMCTAEGDKNGPNREKCCKEYISDHDIGALRTCESYDHYDVGGNCHQLFYWNGTLPPPAHTHALRRRPVRAKCARHSRAPRAMSRRGKESLSTVQQPAQEEGGSEVQVDRILEHAALQPTGGGVDSFQGSTGAIE